MTLIVLFSCPSWTSSLSMDPHIGGQVFVCTNKWCREKGSDATMATFTFLTPPSVPVVGVNCLGRCNKGPNCRILNKDGNFKEASMVRSVERVVDLLQKHLNLDINVTSADVLRLNYEGNVHLRNGQVDSAIACYDAALRLGDREQEGVLLVMRGTALLQRAYMFKMRHRDTARLAEEVLPAKELILAMCQALPNPLDFLARTSRVYSRLDSSSSAGQKWEGLRQKWPDLTADIGSGDQLISRVAFFWSLYEHALFSALQDLLTATVVLPGFAQAWRRAGDALSEIRMYSSAVDYYEVASSLDESLSESLVPVVERLRVMDRLVENAEAKGWSTDAILSLIDE